MELGVFLSGVIYVCFVLWDTCFSMFVWPEPESCIHVTDTRHASQQTLLLGKGYIVADGHMQGRKQCNGEG